MYRVVASNADLLPSLIINFSTLSLLFRRFWEKCKTNVKTFQLTPAVCSIKIYCFFPLNTDQIRSVEICLCRDTEEDRDMANIKKYLNGFFCRSVCLCLSRVSRWLWVIFVSCQNIIQHLSKYELNMHFNWRRMRGKKTAANDNKIRF